MVIGAVFVIVGLLDEPIMLALIIAGSRFIGSLRELGWELENRHYALRFPLAAEFFICLIFSRALCCCNTFLQKLDKYKHISYCSTVLSLVNMNTNTEIQTYRLLFYMVIILELLKSVSFFFFSFPCLI